MTWNRGCGAVAVALGVTVALSGCIPRSPSYDVIIGDDGSDAAVPPTGSDAATGTVITEKKYLLLVDTSGSMQCTDENNFRVTLAGDATAVLGGEPGNELGLIRFNESIDVADNTGDGIADFFASPTSDPAYTGVLSRLNTAEGPSSFQSALLAAYDALNDHMLNNTWGSGSVANTGYAVIIITDGVPGPECLGDELQGSGECSGGQCGNTLLFCETPREDWATIGLDPNDPNLFYGYEDGMNFNLPEDVLNLVDDIVGLGALHGAGSVSVHALYLHPPTFMNGTCSGWDPLFGTDPAEAISFLTDLTNRGDGTLRTDYDAAVDWLGFF